MTDNDKIFEEYKMKIPDHGVRNPAGYRILIYPLKPKERTAGGIIKTQDTLDHEADVVMSALVLQLGPEAYADTAKFKKSWCNVGDWVMVSRHAGIRIKAGEEILRIINDDEVIAVMADPTKIVKK